MASRQIIRGVALSRRQGLLVQRRCLSKQAAGEGKDKTEQQEQDKTEDKKNSGFFSQLKEELDQNADVKKAWDELKSDQKGVSVGQVFQELKKEWGLGGSTSTEKGEGKSGEAKTETEKEKATQEEGDKTTEEAKSGPSLKSRLRSVREKLWAKLPDSFGNDEKSWEDAFKAVFGVKTAKKKAATPAEEVEWFEAVDKETGDRYYYNNAGQTVWEKPETGKIIRDADEEAHAAAEHERQAVQPSFLENKIAEIAQEISGLEEQRDAAMADSDMGKFKELNKKIREMRKEIERLSAQANTTAVVHVEEKKGAWEQFNERLREAPIIKNIFGIADSDVAKKARDAAEDAREALETSQNPLVYRMYSVYDSMFAETEMGEAIREFRRMDPDFTIEDFLDEVQDEIAPKVLRAFLEGDIKTLDEYCSEGAAAAVKASIKDRMAAGRKSDTNILSIGEIHLAAAKVVDKMGPMLVVQFMVQQINCLYDLKGNVVEGKEDEIIGVFYIFALTREYDEETLEYRWRIKELAIGGTTPYL